MKLDVVPVPCRPGALRCAGPGDDDDDEPPIGDPPDDDEGDDWDDDDDDDEEPLQAVGYCAAASPPGVHPGTMQPNRTLEPGCAMGVIQGAGRDYRIPILTPDT